VAVVVVLVVIFRLALVGLVEVEQVDGFESAITHLFQEFLAPLILAVVAVVPMGRDQVLAQVGVAQGL
jgi:hypothetical protein